MVSTKLHAPQNTRTWDNKSAHAPNITPFQRQQMYTAEDLFCTIFKV